VICERSFPLGKGVRRLPHTNNNKIELTKIVGAPGVVVALRTAEPPLCCCEVPVHLGA